MYRAEGGTWLGVSKSGRFAVLTNYRCRKEELRVDAKSRGALVHDITVTSCVPTSVCSLMDCNSSSDPCPNAGCLVVDFLASNVPPQDYCHGVLQCHGDYNGFSLIAASLSRSSPPSAYSHSNVGGAGAEPQQLAEGCYGLSNSLLGAPWRKVEYGRGRFAGLLSASRPSDPASALTEQLLGLLADTTR